VCVNILFTIHAIGLFSHVIHRKSMISFSLQMCHSCVYVLRVIKAFD